jgi:diaminopimelate decarboxylase
MRVAPLVRSAPARPGLPPGDDCLSAPDGRLHVEDVPAEDLAARFGTPLYVVSEGQLRGNAARWKAAAGAAWTHGPVLVMPSLKASTVLALRRILDAEGLGCDVFGPWELELALRAGTPAALISLNGATKPDAAIERAVATGARVTLDSLDELERTRAAAARLGRQARVALRVRPWLPGSAEESDFAPGTPARVAVQDYRAGMTDADAAACLEVLRGGREELTLTGLMAHASRQTVALGFWRDYAREIGARTAAAAAAMGGGWRPAEIDLGGGFAPPRDPTGRRDPARADAPAAPAPEAYCEALAGGLAEGLGQGGLAPDGITLQIEPGRAIYASAGLHLSRVRHVKAQLQPVARRWIETDTSEAFLGDVNLEHSRFACVLAGDTGRPRRADTAVTGISCGFDVLVPAGDAPDAQAGDLLAFLDTGAYQDSAASNFNAMPRPGTVLVSGADALIVRRAEGLDDLLAREVPA